MQRHGQRTAVPERLASDERAAARQTDNVRARTVGCSVWTGWTWGRIDQRAGRAGLSPRLGRPATPARSHGQAPLDVFSQITVFP